MSDEPVAPCPECGCGARRLISGGAGLLFKGEGFYITDHRSESYRERARAEAGAAPHGKDGGSNGSKEGDKTKKAEKTSDASARASESAAGAAD